MSWPRRSALALRTMATMLSLARTDPADKAVGHLPWRSALLAGLVVLSAVLWEASPAAATHAYRCDTMGDPTVNRVVCLPHQAWDAVSGGHPEGVVCALQDTLGVDHVKDCHASP
jgi:hypothetical protein